MRRLAGGVAAVALMAGESAAQERFPTLTPDTITAAQKPVAAAIAAGPRKSLGGPFNAWLRDPELADRLQKVGEQLRFHSHVPPRLNEFAILITARAWDADYEWYAHYPLALKAGLKPQVAADLALGKRPTDMADDEATVFDFLTTLRTQKRVGDGRFAKAKALLGEAGVIDLVALAGYYDLVSMTLNVAEVKPPEPGPLPLPKR